MRERIRAYQNGSTAALVSGIYVSLVLTLGIVSAIILLTVQDPILLSGLALMAVTFPLGGLIWWAWDLLPVHLADPLVLLLLLCIAGLLQTWLIWRLLRGPRWKPPVSSM